MQKQRLMKELAKMTQSPPKGISLSAKDDKLNVFEASILGPENTPYSNGTFHLELRISENYPFSPPSIKFKTKIYHPNIDTSGGICLDLLKMPPKGNWKPTIGLEGLLIAVRMLLETPNPEDPIIHYIAAQMKNDYAKYEHHARLYTEKYAIQ